MIFRFLLLISAYYSPRTLPVYIGKMYLIKTLLLLQDVGELRYAKYMHLITTALALQPVRLSATTNAARYHKYVNGNTLT